MSNDNKNKNRPHQTNRTKINSEENHPCLREHKVSMKCLDSNNYDHDSCKKQFANYNACMGFWNKVKGERRRKGISPDLPPPEEREAIIKEHYQQ